MLIPIYVPYLQCKTTIDLILIADSGSTKCDWAHFSNEGVLKKFQTKGLNPQVQSRDYLQEQLKHCSELDEIKEDVEQVFMYVSGCSTPEHENIVRDIVKERLPQVKSIEVVNDLMGAARACLGDESGLMAILGTGSNLAYYDGKKLHSATPSLGYVFGDEGSGYSLGKNLITSYFYNKMPADIAKKFSDVFALTKDEFLQKLYREEGANRFVASWAPFAVENKEHEFVRALIKSNFYEFVEAHVLGYKSEQRTKISFVGSIPVVLRDLLEESLADYDIKLGNCIAKPIDGLINYHKQKIG